VQELLRQVVPLALAAAVSPTVLAVAVLTLTASRRPVARGVLFTIGVFVVVGVLTVLGLTVMAHVTHHPSATRRAVSDGVDVVFGLVLLALAARSAFRRRSDHTDEPVDAPNDDHTVRTGLGAAFVTGLVMMATNVTSIVLYLPAMKEITKSQVSESDKAIVTVLAMLLVSLPAWLPVLLRVVAPGPSQRALTSLNTTIQRHQHTIVLTVEVVFGAYLLAKGLQV
jgi:threonine/homoserine/homoserine lactone efflux protein